MPFGTSGPVKGPRVLVQRFWCNLGANMISRNFVDTFCSARYVPSSRWSLPQLCFIQALNSSHPRDRRGQSNPHFQPHTRCHFPNIWHSIQPNHNRLDTGPPHSISQDPSTYHRSCHGEARQLLRTWFFITMLGIEYYFLFQFFEVKIGFALV